MDPHEHMSDNAEILRELHQWCEDAWDDRQWATWFLVSAAYLGARIGAWLTRKRYGAC